MRTVRNKLLTAMVSAALLASQPPVNADAPRFLFGTASLVEPISTPGVGENTPSPTTDELELFFATNYGSGSVADSIMVANRDSKVTPFGLPVPLSSLNDEDRRQLQPSISLDALTLYYITVDPVEDAPGEVWTASRPTRDQPFGHPTLLFEPQAGWSYTAPSVSADGLSLYMQYTDLVRWDAEVYVSQRGSDSEPWGEPEPVPELSDPNHWQSRPFLSADGLSLFFYDSYTVNTAGARPGTADLAVMVRPSVDAPWSASVNLGNAINTGYYEDFGRLSADGHTLYFDRWDASAQGADWYNGADIWQAPVLPFDTVKLSGAGDRYSQDFDTLTADATGAGTPLPTGWTFTANDIVFNNTTTDRYPATRRNYAGTYNAGLSGDADRALVTDYSLEEGGELDLRAEIGDAPVQALRLGFDLEAWQVLAATGTLAEAAFQVVLEADSGSGFEPVADLGIVTTGKTLMRAASVSLVDGNHPANRTTYDSGPRDVGALVPQNATLRVRWISTDVSRRTVVFGLDNVSLLFAAAGDANVDGLFNSADLVQVFTAGEYEDAIADNSQWMEGDWNNDDEFDSGDLVVAFQGGGYEQAAGAATVPEPSTNVSLLASTVAIAAFARRTLAGGSHRRHHVEHSGGERGGSTFNNQPV